MKRSGTAVTWPRRDSRHFRFAMLNRVWAHKLKPAEFVIFSFLCYHSSHSQTGPPTLEAISNSVHMTENTVKKYLASLVSKGLVSAEGICSSDFQKPDGEKFFTLPNEIFLLRIPPSAFVVYAYLLLIEYRQTHTCHPSYNTIAAETGLSKNTAMKGIGILLEMSLIAVTPSWYFDQHGMKWKGNNLYTILPVEMALDEFHRRQIRKLEEAVTQMHITKNLKARAEHPA